MQFQSHKLSFWDYAGVVGLSRLPATWIEYTLGIGLEVVFSTWLGVIFVFSDGTGCKNQALDFAF